MTKVVTVVTSAPSGEWKKTTWSRDPLSVGVGSTNEFEVYELKDGDNVYLRPIRPYYVCEFERLFQFGICCEDYDENRIIKISK